MTPEIERTQESIKAFCKKIGSNRLLVQGAGGNVSWKEGETLWIKASGAWLADAEGGDIFVPVNLRLLNEANIKGEFSALPKVLGSSTLKPSIETLLHGLMPHKIVIHLHMVDALALLVLKDGKNIIKSVMGESFNWVFIDYFKPGPDLARAVSQAIASSPEVDTLFLKNHGIVIGGASIKDVEVRIDSLTRAFNGKIFVKTPSTSPQAMLKKIPEAYINFYKYIDDSDIQSLALDPFFFHKTTNDWALYPDHVVFLGSKAFTYEGWADFSKCVDLESLPELIFIRNIGVFASKSFGKAKCAQLLTFFDVISRLSEGAVVSPLGASQVDEVLSWEAEKYRLGRLKT